MQAAAGRLLFGGDPAAVLDGEDPVRAIVNDAVLQATHELDHKRDERLSRMISNEILTGLKRMFG